jgi:hypothetical protein
VATLLGDAESARQRLAAADALAGEATDAVAVSPPQRIRRHTLEGAALSLGADPSQAEVHFQRAEMLAAENGEVAWSARWRNRLAHATHLQRQQRGDEASAQFAHALALLEARDPGRDSGLRRQLGASARASDTPVRAEATAQPPG